MAHAKYPRIRDVFETRRPADDQSAPPILLQQSVYRRFSRNIVEALALHYREIPTSSAGN